MALRVRGETVEEITGAVRAMRAQDDRASTRRRAPSTPAAPAATPPAPATSRPRPPSWWPACGVPVAKHGNRGLSSQDRRRRCAGGARRQYRCRMALVRQALWDAKICFMMAPRHHGAMRHVGPTRVELGTRTIFNLMGPLSNPAGAKRQLIGVFSARLDRADGRGAGQAGQRARLGRPWQRRARRADHHRPHLRRRA